LYIDDAAAHDAAAADGGEGCHGPRRRRWCR
jgi:hypothetical protein